MLIDLFQIIVFFIGLIALFSVLSALFFAINRGPDRIYTNNPVPVVSSEDFLLAMSYTVNSPVETGGAVTILNNGDAFYPELLKEIANAKKNINFTVYIWEDGQVSKKVLEALTAKQKQGVQVRILFDFFGGTGATFSRFQQLLDAGGKVVKFRTLRFGKITSIHRRTHRRSIVIDGQVGFTGGMAIKDAWLGNARNPKEWRDIMFKVTGPMARNLQSAFTDLWTSSTGEILFGAGIYQAHNLIQEHTGTKFIHLVSSPTDSLPLTKFILLSMMAAKEKLYITTPYFIPDSHMLTTIKERVKAGVDVRLMLPNKHVDNKTVRWNAQNFYHELLESGVKIYEYQPTFIHAKYFVVDGQWSVIGSANQNYRSRHWDEENTFGILNNTLGAELENIFLEDMKSSKEITLKTWKKRGTLLKFAVVLSRIIREQS